MDLYTIKKHTVEEMRRSSKNTYWYHILVNKWIYVFINLPKLRMQVITKCISLRDNNGFDDMFGEKDSFLSSRRAKLQRRYIFVALDSVVIT